MLILFAIVTNDGKKFKCQQQRGFSIVRLGLVFLSYLVVILGCKYGKEMMEQFSM